MSPQRRRLSLSLALWVLLAPLLSSLTGCFTAGAADKRLLQHLNQEGFGKRYAGNAQEQNYVTIGDSIQFFDAYNKSLQGVEQVGIDGTILLPQAGSVFVAGMTRSELESFLTQKLSPYFARTDVRVKIRTGGQRAYYVLGEVRAKGRKIFQGDITVFEAVIQSQPSEHTANLGRVRLIRADPRDPFVMDVNVADMWRNGDSSFNLSVQEYDIIYVPPTLLKQLADIVSAIIVPIVSPLRTILNTIFFIENQGRFNNLGFNNRF